MTTTTESQITSGKAESTIDTLEFDQLLEQYFEADHSNHQRYHAALIAHIEAVREKDIKELKHALWCAEVNLVSRHEHNAELTKRAEKAEAELKAIAERQAAGLSEDGVVYEADDGTVCKKRHGELIWHAHIYINNESLDDVAVAQEVVAALTALPPAQQEPASAEDKTLPVELVGIAEAIKEGDGFWRPCSGCYDTEDGHPTAKYTYSEVFQCAMGCGCHECGGLGVVWDSADYEAMYVEEAASATDADRPCECFGGQARCKAPSPCPAQATPEGGQAKKHEEAVTNILGSADGAVKADQTGIYK